MRQVKGESLDEQETKIRAWCKAHGHRLVGVLREEGVSGSNGLATREALPEALHLLRARRADGLVITELDRLHRDLLMQEQLLAEVWQRPDAEVFSCSPTEAVYVRRDDPEDPDRKFVRQMLGAVAEYNRAMTVLRLRRGRRHKAARGGFAYGAPPFGKQAHDKALVPKQREAAAVARIVELRRAGRSYREIARTLDTDGLQPRKAEHWSPMAVRNVAVRELGGAA